MALNQSRSWRTVIFAKEAVAFGQRMFAAGAGKAKKGSQGAANDAAGAGKAKKSSKGAASDAAGAGKARKGSKGATSYVPKYPAWQQDAYRTLNILKDGADPKIMPDSECPDRQQDADRTANILKAGADSKIMPDSECPDRQPDADRTANILKDGADPKIRPDFEGAYRTFITATAFLYKRFTSYEEAHQWYLDHKSEFTSSDSRLIDFAAGAENPFQFICNVNAIENVPKDPPKIPTNPQHEEEKH